MAYSGEKFNQYTNVIRSGSKNNLIDQWKKQQELIEKYKAKVEENDNRSKR